MSVTALVCLRCQSTHFVKNGKMNRLLIKKSLGASRHYFTVKLRIFSSMDLVTGYTKSGKPVFEELAGIKRQKVSGFVTGIFPNKDNERVFYSLGEKSAQMSGTNSDSKIDNPGKDWKHPSLVEIVIGYCQEEDNFPN